MYLVWPYIVCTGSKKGLGGGTFGLVWPDELSYTFSRYSHCDVVVETDFNGNYAKL